MHIPRRDVLSVVGQLRHRPTDKQKGYSSLTWNSGWGAMFRTTRKIMPQFPFICCTAGIKNGGKPPLSLILLRNYLASGISGTINRATILIILISGLTAGPAVSL